VAKDAAEYRLKGCYVALSDLATSAGGGNTLGHHSTLLRDTNENNS
jgi:hypothetical protein